MGNIWFIFFIAIIATKCANMHLIDQKKMQKQEPIINRPLSDIQQNVVKNMVNRPIFRFPVVQCKRLTCHMYCFESNIYSEFSGECRCNNIKRHVKCNMDTCRHYCNSCNAEYSISMCYRTLCKCYF